MKYFYKFFSFAFFTMFLQTGISYSQSTTYNTTNIKQVTIAEARKDDNHDLFPDYYITGDTLMVTGTITANFTSQTNKAVFFIQDITGGIQVLYAGALPTTNFTVGDSVFVIGKILQFHGNDEIDPLSLDTTNFGIIKHNAIIPAPMQLSLHQYLSNAENYEGRLIEIDTLYKVSGAWPGADTSGLIFLTNLEKTDTTEMFIYAATKIGGTAEPTYPIDVVGIAGQYSSGPSVVTGGYYIDPRDIADISNIVIAGINDNYRKVSTYRLYQNYPNPFNPSTVINFTIPKAGNVSLKVYNMLGQEVATLVDGYKAAQTYNVNFDASNLSSGVYFYSVKFDNQILSKKMILIK